MPMRFGPALTGILAGIVVALGLPHQPARADEIASLFNDFDANRDGGITLEEFAQRRATRFAQYDTNADQAISLEEFTAGLSADKIEKRKQRFLEMDTDHNGRLTESDMADRARNQFGEMDKNGDSKVDLPEFTAAVHPVQESN